MQFAAALVEYLVTGIVATLWAAPLLEHLKLINVQKLLQNKEMLGVVYFPIAYILGIYIDAISSLLIRRCRQIFKILWKERYARRFSIKLQRVARLLAGKPGAGSYSRSARILAASPDSMAQTMHSYVSRDRIARGMALNSLVGACIALIVAQPEQRLGIVVSCLIFAGISLMVWLRLARLSGTFKAEAIKNLAAAPPKSS